MFENAVKQVQAMARTYKLALEKRLGVEIGEDHPIMPWLIKHGAANKNRLHLGKDGMTAQRRLRGRNFRRSIVEFGECVWYLKPKSKGKDKLKTRWESGVFLGIRDESAEVFIGTENGVVKVRTIKRKGSDEERWNLVQVDKMAGTPWEPQPGRESFNVESKITVREEQELADMPEIPEGVERPRNRNRFHSRAAGIEKYGPPPPHYKHPRDR